MSRGDWTAPGCRHWWLLIALLLAPALPAQTVFEDSRRVGLDTPEGWAMAYVSASSLMTGFGGDPQLAPWQWAVSAELASIPHLSQAQQQVGFSGAKAEDLNKSPVFGRGRVWLGLPGRWVAELGYTPELTIDGAQPEDLFSLALGRELYAVGNWSGYGRGMIQRGRAGGDITCPRSLAGDQDPLVNPFGCAGRSRDRLEMDYQGLELINRWQPAAHPLHYSLGVGWVHLKPRVQVDAPLFFDVRDRSRLVSSGNLRYFSLGLGRRISPRWDGALELLYVPLKVQRSVAQGRENDPYWSLRLQLRWRRGG